MCPWLMTFGSIGSQPPGLPAYLRSRRNKCIWIISNIMVVAQED